MNNLAGEPLVARLQEGVVTTEVVLALSGGIMLAAIVTAESSREQELAVGADAMAMFKASSVTIGVPA